VALSAMASDRYQLGMVNGSQIDLVKSSGDVLTVAASTASSDIYFESSATTSTIQRLSGGASRTITDGQSPSLSPDGKLLAVIRESRGRGALWMRNLGTTNEHQFTSDDYDVLEASFINNHDLIMAARFQGSTSHLFRVDLVSGRTELLPILGRVRYPAISPDGRRLSFSKFEGTSWHLYVRSIESGAEMRLNAGNCNAVEAVWQSANTLVYASDCGRGLGLSALGKSVLK
jgi:Tol biopolymer transport system component